MTLSPSLRDELLSAYLDGEVSQDERATVERWLAEDPAIVERLEQLQRLCSQVGDLATSQTSKLNSEFASQVMQAVFKAAADEPLTAQHPVRLAQQRALQNETKGAGRGASQLMKWAGFASAIAASIALVFFLRQSIAPQSFLAQVDPVKNDRPPSTEGSNSADNSSVEKLLSPASEPILKDDRNPSSVAVAADSSLAKEATIAAAPRVQEIVPANSDSVPRAESQAMAAPLLAEKSGVKPNVETPPKASKGSSRKVLAQFAMVLEVHLTAGVDDLSPIRESLAVAGISPLRSQSVGEDILQQLATAKMVAEDPPSQATGEQNVQLLVLEAPAKKIDQFFLDLLFNRPEVASVGMNLAMDLPTVQVVQQITNVRPTEVQHEVQAGVAQHLVGTEASKIWFRRATNGPVFSPVSKSTPPMSVGSLGDSGPDIVSTLVLLVRSSL